MIHEGICTYEVAKLAKEKGFNVPTAEFYNEDGDIGCYPRAFTHNEFPDGDYAAPTQSLLQRWLREEKALHIQITLWEKGWYYDIWAFEHYEEEKEYSAKMLHQSKDFTTYELALEDALAYSLKNLV